MNDKQRRTTAGRWQTEQEIVGEAEQVGDDRVDNRVDNRDGGGTKSSGPGDV
jgi:hypothetical protein